MKPEIKYLDIGLMEKMCHPIAVDIFDSKQDPISKFSEHNDNLLDSALNLPRATFSSQELYPTLIDKAAILYYALNKNHAFRNGNKRIATASLMVFLFINDHWLDAGDTEIVDMTLYVAKSTGTEKDIVLVKVKNWLSQHVVGRE